jgi:dolichol kinase
LDSLSRVQWVMRRWSLLDCSSDYLSKRPSWLRKLMHLATAIVPAAGWLLSYWLSLALALALLLASLAVEGARRLWPWLNQLLWRLLPSVFRPWEGRRVLGVTWLALGMAATLLLYGQDAGGTAVLFLAWGDPVAEFVGRRWGRPGAAKTLVGSLGCLAACLLAGFVGVGLGGLSVWAVLVGAVAATVFERWSFPPDDNVWMPVLSGLAISVVEWLLGGKTVLLPLWH